MLKRPANHSLHNIRNPARILAHARAAKLLHYPIRAPGQVLLFRVVYRVFGAVGHDVWTEKTGHG